MWKNVWNYPTHNKFVSFCSIILSPSPFSRRLRILIAFLKDSNKEYYKVILIKWHSICGLFRHSGQYKIQVATWSDRSRVDLKWMTIHIFLLSSEFQCSNSSINFCWCYDVHDIYVKVFYVLSAEILMQRFPFEKKQVKCWSTLPNYSKTLLSVSFFFFFEVSWKF